LDDWPPLIAEILRFEDGLETRERGAGAWSDDIDGGGCDANES
jgi:hypothetical protein